MCVRIPWSPGPTLTQSASACTWGSWWRSGTRVTLPTQHQKLLMSYCCTLLWNIIALWCVNKAGVCCHDICSPAGQTSKREGGGVEGTGVKKNTELEYTSLHCLALLLMILKIHKCQGTILHFCLAGDPSVTGADPTARAQREFRKAD